MEVLCLNRKNIASSDGDCGITKHTNKNIAGMTTYKTILYLLSISRIYDYQYISIPCAVHRTPAATLDCPEQRELIGGETAGHSAALVALGEHITFSTPMGAVGTSLLKAVPPDNQHKGEIIIMLQG